MEYVIKIQNIQTFTIQSIIKISPKRFQTSYMNVTLNPYVNSRNIMTKKTFERLCNF